jgi:LacI family transcriptional regulator
MEQRATLKNISRILNISISTVSRALKDHPDIADETKKLVREIASKLDYEPNPYAIGLRTDKRNLVGVIVPFISNIFYQSFIAAMEEEAKKKKYSLLILQSADNPQDEQENLRICRANRVAAVFVCISPYTKDISAFLNLARTHTPVIFFDKVPAYEACDKVCIDDEGVATIAAKTIIKKTIGRVLGLFGNPELSITKKRKKAFHYIFEINNRTDDLKIVHVISQEEAKQEVKKSFAKKAGPGTIFCMSDDILSGVMKAVQQMQLKIPVDVKIISISNDGFIPKLFEPEITYVETSGYELGKLCFRRMTDYMNGKTFIQEVLLPARLVPGASI